jgi:hypothetical protein
MSGSSHNRVRLNAFYGNGAATSKSSPSDPNSNNFGLGLIGASERNLVEKNKIGGNINGVYLGGLVIGNIIRGNFIAGNPAAQVLSIFGRAIGADIQDLSPAGANSFEENYCLTYAGAGTSPCPNILERHNEDNENGENDREESGMTAFRVTAPFPTVFPYGRSGWIRLTLPQARLVNAAFHPSGRLFPKAAAASANTGGGTTDSATVTITGKVVDAACYMVHAPAATAATHKDCGAACLARGVPLAIAADDGALYFPADGNQRLKTLLNARVRASGMVVEKHEPLELKMPVGDKNQMVVRVEGGYKQISIQTLEKLPPAKRPST